ncbi:MAG: fibrillarin-like rRNA/tRNA 2'-O-methyltransferase [Candidatus Hydrothermarchaeales archaeon]
MARHPKGNESIFKLDVNAVDNLAVIGDRLATKNLVPGTAVYGERLVPVNGVEYRLWNPKRSKLAAAIYNGLENLPIKRDSRILYLGAASGTTASHVSDIAADGMVYCVDFSPRVFRELMYVCEPRKNMIPILADASQPRRYLSFLEKCDLVYQDIAQPNQGEILLENAGLYLKTGGYVAMAVKARSIDVTEEPEAIFRREELRLKEAGFKIVSLNLEPYDKDHVLLTGKRR